MRHRVREACQPIRDVRTVLRGRLSSYALKPNCHVFHLIFPLDVRGDEHDPSTNVSTAHYHIDKFHIREADEVNRTSNRSCRMRVDVTRPLRVKKT
jgi:hypothetical protein